MNMLRNILISALAVGIAAWIVPGVTIEPFWVAIVVVIVLAVVNAFLGTLLRILTFPITVLTLGLWSLVISVLMIVLVDAIVPGFETSGFRTSALFGLVLALVNMGMRLFGRDSINNGR